MGTSPEQDLFLFVSVNLWRPLDYQFLQAIHGSEP